MSFLISEFHLKHVCFCRVLTEISTNNAVCVDFGLVYVDLLFYF